MIILSIIPLKKSFDDNMLAYGLIYTYIFIKILEGPFCRTTKMIVIGVFTLIKSLQKLILSTLLVICVFCLKSHDIYRFTARFMYSCSFENQNQPTIYIANYPSDLLEYLIPGLFASKTALVINNASIFIPIFMPDRAIVVDMENPDNYLKILENVKNKIKNGFNIFSYVEKKYYKRKHKYHLTKFRTGMFRIAHELGIPITPVVATHFEPTCGIDFNKSEIKVLEPFLVPKNIKECTDSCYIKMSRILTMYKYRS